MAKSIDIPFIPMASTQPTTQQISAAFKADIANGVKPFTIKRGGGDQSKNKRELFKVLFPTCICCGASLDHDNKAASNGFQIGHLFVSWNHMGTRSNGVDLDGASELCKLYGWDDNRSAAIAGSSANGVGQCRACNDMQDTTPGALLFPRLEGLPTGSGGTIRAWTAILSDVQRISDIMQGFNNSASTAVHVGKAIGKFIRANAA